MFFIFYYCSLICFQLLQIVQQYRDSQRGNEHTLSYTPGMYPFFIHTSSSTPTTAAVSFIVRGTHVLFESHTYSYVQLLHAAAVVIFDTYCCCIPDTGTIQSLVVLGLLDVRRMRVSLYPPFPPLPSTRYDHISIMPVDTAAVCSYHPTTSVSRLTACEVVISFEAIGVDPSRAFLPPSVLLCVLTFDRSVLFCRWLTVGEATVLFLWVVAMGSQCWQGTAVNVYIKHTEIFSSNTNNQIRTG